ncbi:MAG: glycosyltransferase, partial [Acidobacteria bacterium]|nr:glycosyltransferase [Acidobacteriota bacterium]
SHEEKVDLLGRARAVLFPIQWEEPFGLVMPEANACGTPVVAFARGSAPEVIADGETGFVVEDLDAMCEAVLRAGEISPEACRRRAREQFSAEAMVRGYAEVYARVLGAR